MAPSPEGPLLVTGATGFIGRRLTQMLLRDPRRRLLILGRRRPDFLLSSQARRVKFLKADLGDPRSLRRHAKALRQACAAVHLGGYALRSSHPSGDDPVLARRDNEKGTAALLKLLPRLRGLVYASTIDVYGRPRTLPMREGHPTRPLSAYGRSKLAGERLALAFGRKTSTPVTVLRLAQVYGPGDPSDKAIPHFIRHGLHSQGVSLNGGGSELRSVLYVDDAAEAVLRALEGRAEGVFNVAGSRSASIRSIARRVLSLCGSRRPVRLCTRHGAPAVSLVLDDSRARKAMGYRPRVFLRSGLMKTIRWFRAHDR